MSRLTCSLSRQVTDWLDFVLGKSDQPPSFMRREGPPERKRMKKLGEGSGGAGGSSSRGTPPAGLAAGGGGGSARAAFGGGGPRSGPFGQVRGVIERIGAGDGFGFVFLKKALFMVSGTGFAGCVDV